MIAGWPPALRLSVGTVTALPTGAVEVTPAVAGRAMTLAPLAAVPVALAAAGVGWLAHALQLPPLLVGLVAVGALALGTRGLHLDGLADTTDGLASGWDRERALAIMRRGDVGPLGVVALVLCLTAQAVAAGVLLTGWPGALLFAVAACASRVAVPLCCVRGVPAARTEGLGAAVAGSVPPTAVVLGWLVAALGLAGAGWPAGVVWWQALLAIAAGLAASAALLRHCVRRFGGMTGDVIGACVEAACTAVLVVLAA